VRPDELLSDLDADQRAAVTEPVLPLAILAPAGSGKTRVLTRRLGWQAATERIEPGHTLALTYTRKAAGELRARLRHLGVREGITAGTFHAVALAQLRRLHTDRGTRMPELLERKARILGPMLGRGSGAERAIALTELAAEIEWAKARLVTPPRYVAAAEKAGRRIDRRPEDIAQIYARYEQEKARRGLVDFDDLINECARALETDVEFGALQRWRFRHLFVDEFQDSTRAQLRLLRAWLGDGVDLCVVGDPDQSIYGFAGAVPGALERFAEWLPGGTTVRLGTNYRSTPQIVSAARAVLPGRTAAPVRAAAADGPSPEVTVYDDGEAEAAGIAAALQRAQRDGRRWSDLAVLYRVNAQSAAFEESLGRVGIPCRVRGGVAFLDRPEVRALLDALHDGARAAPGRAFVDHLTDLVVESAEHGEERQEHAEVLATLGREYLAAEGATGSVAGFDAYLRAALRGGDDGGLSADAVDLLTFHRAKGLEWDTVFVTGLERGLVPISHAQDDSAALDEERRLLYVACSRARHVLHLSRARERARGMRSSKRSASPYLAEIQRALAGGKPATTPVEANRRGASRARAALAAATLEELGPNERRLYDQLVEWRLAQARAADVPAFVIFDNKTLVAVARRRPTTRDALLAVPGVGPTKLDRYGAAVLELVGRG